LFWHLSPLFFFFLFLILCFFFFFYDLVKRQTSLYIYLYKSSNVFSPVRLHICIVCWYGITPWMSTFNNRRWYNKKMSFFTWRHIFYLALFLSILNAFVRFFCREKIIIKYVKFYAHIVAVFFCFFSECVSCEYKMNRRVKIDWKPTTQTHAYRHTYIYILGERERTKATSVLTKGAKNKAAWVTAFVARTDVINLFGQKMASHAQSL